MRLRTADPSSDMSVNSRQKGARYERELAKHFRGEGYDSRRGVQYKGGPDSPDVVGLPGIHIEAKHVERLNLYDAMAQSIRDASPDELPVVIHRRNREESLVTMSLDNWLKLYKAWERSTK